MPTTTLRTEAHANALDAADPLRPVRDRFYVADDRIYLDGNSLGLVSKDAERAVQDALAAWREHGIDGWLGVGSSCPPWFTLAELLGARLEPLVGAEPGSVIVTGSTTVNLHQLLATFYRPTATRRTIIATGLDFPSDIYALQSQIRLHGGEPERDLVRVPSRDGRTIDEADVLAAIGDDTTLVMMPSVLYRSGQVLDVGRIARAAHDAGALAGLDCAHSVGAMPHDFAGWGIDLATWCTYKYLNAGPGATGALYVNPRHWGTAPALAGWWGYRKDRQFAMAHHWEGAAGAGAFQIGTVPVLATVALSGSLDIFEAAGIGPIRAKSLALTDFLIGSMEEAGLLGPPYGYGIGTPREHTRRGGHVAVEHAEAHRISLALRERGVVVDFRQPNVVRLAPIALYTSFHDVWRAVQALREIIDTGAHLAITPDGAVT